MDRLHGVRDTRFEPLGGDQLTGVVHPVVQIADADADGLRELSDELLVAGLDAHVDDVCHSGIGQLQELSQGRDRVVVEVTADQQLRGHEVRVGDLELRQSESGHSANSMSETGIRRQLRAGSRRHVTLSALAVALVE